MSRCIDCQYFNADMEMPWCNTYDQDVDPFDDYNCCDYAPNEDTEKKMGILLLEAEHRAESAESELAERRELQEAQSKAIVREQKRAEAAERAVGMLIQVMTDDSKCPPNITISAREGCGSDGDCRECWLAWATKEGEQ